MKHIILTGGGTAGHVTPNIALIPHLKELGYRISYIGSIGGIEEQLISEMDIPYYGIPTGKLRRYLSVDNLKDPFKVFIVACIETPRIHAAFDRGVCIFRNIINEKALRRL